ncbi:uncharacterized protein LOC142986188 isoform X2 [Anticarsia gemmatalis]|uniref:uncharacterized protein LOC142986188 isoform X2 n=1 Tax=Anticarsia gemmatalis TaxID=129554 RepID=UPI003F75A0F3
MVWVNVLVVLCAVTTGLAINRPVYKIVLTQKGYAQFLQYDIDTPPIREFTFCTWFRVYDITGDQSIFTYYVVEGNNRVVRLWLDSGGKRVSISINSEVTSSSPVEVTKDTWRHVCLSYQSDYGAWALYMDSRLIYCEASQSLSGYVLPGGGSVIIGYGTNGNGEQNGLEGEIFGANMIMKSTIERNHTLRRMSRFEQKTFRKNALKDGESIYNYIVLSDLQTDEVNNNFETTNVPQVNLSKNFIRFKTPHSFIQHEVGLNHVRKPTLMSLDEEIYALTHTADREPVNTSSIWNLSDHSGNYEVHNQNERHEPPTSTSLPVLSEYEVPPPPPHYFNILGKSFESDKPPISDSFYKVVDEEKNIGKNVYNQKFTEELSEVELPPPTEKTTKVYGQWTSSKFAGNVLNYLKNIQSRPRDNKKVVVPSTIPLVKMTDSFPYATEFKVVKVRPPTNFQRKNIVEKQQFQSKRTPQINLQILEEDLRSNIIKTHAQTFPKNVEISNRGVGKTRKERRFYRQVDNHEESEESEENSDELRGNPFDLPKKRKTEDSVKTESNKAKHSDIYTRSLSRGNKWHNVKSYSNDYTPREIKVGFDEAQKNAMDEKVAQMNKKNPAIRLRYRADNRRVVEYKADELLKQGRALAMEVSNQSNTGDDSVSILKYNHGYLPTQKEKPKYTRDRIRTDDQLPKVYSKKSIREDFNRHVKLGNALNERHVIGFNVEDNKKSFIGGDDRVPDINKYRSIVENSNGLMSIPTLERGICKNLGLYDRLLYVQPDESIDLKHILSPISEKNTGIEFIMQNYKKCSLQESELQNDVMLFIDWSRTPVRLFGGAFPKKTTDLCGFF